MKKNSTADANEKELRDRLDELNKERDSLRSNQNDEDSNAQQLTDIEVRMRINNQKRKEILEQLTKERNDKNANSKALDMAKRAARSRVLHSADVVCCTLMKYSHKLKSNSRL
jgi:TolA-binding protein